jgi:uncharacterized protein
MKDNLTMILKSKGNLAIAFSGGVDSTYLLYAAKQALGAENVLAITGRASCFPENETKFTEEFCKAQGIRQIIADIDVLAVPGFAENPPNRCYHCKTAIFQRFIEIAKSEDFFTLAEGSNASDESDYRPGMKALKELNVASPLKEAGLTKEEIRKLSKEAGLSTWDKPSAACLASRFVYGETITKEKLQKVAAAENHLKGLGFTGIRVRVHGQDASLARIELNPKDFERLADRELREEIILLLKKIGFKYVAADLAGYRTGSMNETL